MSLYVICGPAETVAPQSLHKNLKNFEEQKCTSNNVFQIKKKSFLKKNTECTKKENPTYIIGKGT